MQNQIFCDRQEDELKNVLSLIIDHRGKTPKKLGEDWSASGIPAISAKNIKNGKIVNIKDIKFVSTSLYKRWMSEELQAEDILLTSEAPLGELYFLKEKENYVLSQRLFALRANKKRLDPKYLYYYLKGPIGGHQLQRRISGTAAQGIRQAELRKILIQFPKRIVDQKRIASILSAFDDKIEVNNKIAETLEQMAQNIFKEWFVKFRFPGYEKVKFIDSNLGKIPEGWEVKKLNELVTTQYGYTESASEQEIGPKFLRVMDINKSDWIDWSNVPYCKISNRDLEKYRLNIGDIVIARMADPGKIAIIEEDINAVFASYLIRLKPSSNKLSSYFLYYYLTSPQYQNFIFGSSTGTTRQSANARVITDCYLTVPNDELIQEFEVLAASLRKMINNYANENQKLAAMRDLLLPKLMRGKIKV